MRIRNSLGSDRKCISQHPAERLPSSRCIRSAPKRLVLDTACHRRSR
jgi:hypothetical protein